MTKDVFKEFLRPVFEYHGRAPVGENQLAAWWNEVKNIPADALPWMAARLKEIEILPRNVPAKMKSLWNDWLIAFPEKRDKEKKPGCPNCDRGWIHVSYWVEEFCYWGETALKCAHCNRNGEPRCAPAWTLEQVIMSGRFYRPYLDGGREYVKLLPAANQDASARPPEYTHDLDTMIGQVAERMTL